MNGRDTIQLFSNHTIMCLMIFVMPFSGTTELGSNMFSITGFKPLNLLSLLLVIVWLLKKGEILTFHDSIRFRATMIYFAYIIIFSSEFTRTYFNLGVLITRYSADFLTTTSLGFVLSYWLQPLLVTSTFIYIINHIKKENNIEEVIHIILYSIFLFSLATIIVSIDIVMSGGSRSELKEVFQEVFRFHYNAVGSIIMIAVPLGMNKVMTGSKLWFGIFVCIVIALLLTQSRGAIIAATVGMISYFYFLERINIIYTISIIVILGIVGYLLLDPIISLFSIGVDSGDLNSITSGRVKGMWLPLLYELFEDPFKLIFGFGLNGVILSESYVSVPGFYQATHAHNAYINLLIDAGLIIFIPFLILLYFSMKNALKWGKRMNNPTFYALLSSVIVYLVSGISERHFFPTSHNMMLWPIIALLIVMVMNEKRKLRYSDS